MTDDEDRYKDPSASLEQLIDKLESIASKSSFLTGFLSYLLGFAFSYALIKEPIRSNNLYDFSGAFVIGIGLGLMSFFVGWIFVVAAWFLGMKLYQWRTKKL
jgi:uncharacterized membrane protein (DUF485 family)